MVDSSCAVACWKGEVLAGLQGEVLCAQGTHGPSTVVRIIQSEEMAEAAALLVQRLRLSGFCGFDFIIEDGTR